MDPIPAQPPSENLGFASTQWTTIDACAGVGRDAQAAREMLCRDYWYPIYAYIKRVGHAGFDAEDLTQDFLLHILNNRWFEYVDRTKGRFRAFLLASLNNFLRDHFSGKTTLKRGGQYQHIPLDLGHADSRYAQSVSGIGPADVYEVEWASAVVDAAWKRLESGYSTAGRQSEFNELKSFLTASGNLPTHEAAALALATTVENVKVSIHRLRKEYGAILRKEVARTVVSPDEIDDEMRHLRELFATVATAAA